MENFETADETTDKTANETLGETVGETTDETEDVTSIEFIEKMMRETPPPTKEQINERLPEPPPFEPIGRDKRIVDKENKSENN